MIVEIENQPISHHFEQISSTISDIEKQQSGLQPLLQLVDKIPNINKVDQKHKNVNLNCQQMEQKQQTIDRQLQQLSTSIDVNFNKI